MEPRASDDDVEKHPQPPAPNPPRHQRITFLATLEFTLPFLPDSTMAARWLPNCFSQWLRRFRPAAPEVAPLLPVAAPVAAPAPLTASGRARIFEARCYWHSIWFLIILAYLLVFPEMSWEQVFATVFVFECLAIAMQKYRDLFDSPLFFYFFISLSIANL